MKQATIPTKKKCKTCKKDKPLKDYCRKEGMKDGRSSVCKKCQVIYNREKYLSAKDQWAYVF